MANPDQRSRSRAMPRCRRTGASRAPATPNRRAATSQGSRCVVTASRVITLQPAQIDTAAMPNAVPVRSFASVGWLVDDIDRTDFIGLAVIDHQRHCLRANERAVRLAFRIEPVIALGTQP